MSRLPRSLAAVASAVLLLGVAGAAVAYWDGPGTGGDSVGGTTALDVSATAATPSAQLYPGGVADVTLVLANPNPHDVTVPSLALDTTQGSGGLAVDGAHASCSLASLTFTGQSNSGAGWTVPARVGAVDGTLAVTLTGAIAMAGDADSACQGATFTVFVRAGS